MEDVKYATKNYEKFLTNKSLNNFSLEVVQYPSYWRIVKIRKSDMVSYDQFCQLDKMPAGLNGYYKTIEPMTVAIVYKEGRSHYEMNYICERIIKTFVNRDYCIIFGSQQKPIKQRQYEL